MESPISPSDTLSTVSLDHWGLIRARGADAASFLQGQLTNDVVSLGADEIRLAGFCSAKGRLQASFLVWKPGNDELLLACAASVLAATLKRLSMFVMRARCKLEDASGELTLHGVVGSPTDSRFGACAPWRWRHSGSGMELRLPDVDGTARTVLAAPRGPEMAAISAVEPERWKTLEVRSGIPLIESATVDCFVPQMLNFELIGGIDFQKGCYPGQEIVARSQYRGTLKRRMFLFACDGAAAAGQEVFHDTEPDQPAGMVVNAAADVDGSGSIALVEVKLAALDRGSLHLGSVGGAPLRSLPLPYAVPREAAEPA
jgi:tRNA-modifying protein YgfZ